MQAGCSPPPMLWPATPMGALENMPAQRPPYCVLLAALRHLRHQAGAAAQASRCWMPGSAWRHQAAAAATARNTSLVHAVPTWQQLQPPRQHAPHDGLKVGQLRLCRGLEQATQRAVVLQERGGQGRAGRGGREWMMPCADDQREVIARAGGVCKCYVPRTSVPCRCRLSASTALPAPCPTVMTA